jgi:phytoene dehydrogenase-like protein
VPDAVVIGAGPNGLVAANHLADAGWSVVVLEASTEAGGAVRTGEITIPGFRHDLFSAFYPLAAAAPAIRHLRLEDHGLRWAHAPLALAHPLADGRCAVISPDLASTAANLEGFAAGDGDAWEEMITDWAKVEGPLLGTLLGPQPPVREAARTIARLGPLESLRLVRHALLPVRRMTEEMFRGIGAGLLLGGSALHTDLCPEGAGSGLYGWFLCCLAQRVGFPVPRGGAGELTGALVRRLESRRGRVLCNSAVTRVILRSGRAVAVRLQSGDTLDATRAVVADVSVPSLYLDLLPADQVPASLLADLRRFHWDTATVKVDWALSRPVPWLAGAASQAGTVHVADDFNNLTEFSAQIAMGLLPARPFLLFGQQSRADPSRSPPGTETAWAYTHVPRRILGDAKGKLPVSGPHDETSWLDGFVERIESRVEALAPGFRDSVLGRHCFGPAGLQQEDANLHGGAIGGGTAQLHQQLIFRPLPGTGRPETPFAGLYLASSGAHPGGGVHGAAGANAARAALLGMKRSRAVLFGRGWARRTG